LRCRVFQTPEPTVPNPAKPMPREVQGFTRLTVSACHGLSKSEEAKNPDFSLAG